VELDVKPTESQDTVNTIGRHRQDQSSVRRPRLRNKSCEHADTTCVDVCDRPEIQYHPAIALKQACDARSERAGCCAVDNVPAARDDCRVVLQAHV
jgi:hypothetical protein